MDDHVDAALDGSCGNGREENPIAIDFVDGEEKSTSNVFCALPLLDVKSTADLQKVMQSVLQHQQEQLEENEDQHKPTLLLRRSTRPCLNWIIDLFYLQQNQHQQQQVVM